MVCTSEFTMGWNPLNRILVIFVTNQSLIFVGYDQEEIRKIRDDTLHGKYEGMVRTVGFTIGLVSFQLHPRLQPE